MFTLRQRIFTVISIFLVAVLVVVLIIFSLRGKRSPASQISENENFVPEETTPVFDSSLQLPPVAGDPTRMSPTLSDENDVERYVRQRSIDFVERFLSYSNQTRNSHIKDILPIVTPEMALWVQTQAQSYSDDYRGSTTKVIVSRVDAIDEHVSTVHIEAQQLLESAGGDERVYHKGYIALVNVDGTWLIDGLYWE
ncbi:MAG: hypothetical protein UV82_C0002G0093 [Candidatus Magasanikbacteria bacterium GW2011_GWD2_43_18]|uniref:Uncharacterized protein n=1 Tax=Candidatus Magasanikbacteria bacterium GW2011_GWE2_42_7 TaxID=1619052 RepID=A0A0G1BHE8_9BACT|nr:MAG: hypothetical protein UV18_C0003G0093 [Candidatus Magasanikbacteria bacterium GW2011_GWC2_42_27]KKS72604.1 MAG: hypothetical protein UV42_C0006G0004 [Candidatus Magasanikbacteria bacterium GW2011_GWE2_42_7]KKT05123.1 MAG: hypothetical protein UV82_C0002G0093 [Candidatus Magasanikbacteria bacterium GW2011_GWD2_43_18]KKT25786.1 MAG: hypothetical protein UW10_C0004G0061 [Candidatus Magasanikbacteria bacterium GW2011_GWA2_43_9]HBB38071.1 hypothetical protein [Candidatus Magasanikbacteria bac